jgi:hypothetical protein
LPQQSRSFTARVTTVAQEFLHENPDRSSYFILNEHATVGVWVASGRSGGPHVATAGDNMGIYLGPNGGNTFDNDDKDCVWMVSTAVNNAVKVFETIKSFHTVEGAMKT